MQRGFLGASGAGGPVPAAAPTHASPPPPQSPPPQPRAPSQSQLAEVLDLCRGPTDERRLVGLLLATKLLPALGDASGGDGDAGASPLRAVCDAVGLHFLERLMLPLSRSGQAPATTPTPDPDRALKDAGGCALAVAVLSAFVRLPGVAADPAVVGLAPALIKIVSARGAAAALCLPPTAGGVDPATEACARSDALECLVGIVEGGGPLGAAAAGTAALEALAVEPASATGRAPPPPWRGLAVRLAGALLAYPVVSTAADPATLARIVPTLAEALYVPPDAAAAAAAGGGGNAPDPLAAQLAAVHALARLFSLAAACPTLDARLTAAARADAGGWPIVARAGLGGLLRARAGAGARHAAMAAAAGLAGAAGPAWWLAPPPPRVAADPASAPSDFMRVLAEVARVEATLGFRDAEAGGGVVVPLAGGQASAPARPASPPLEAIDVDPSPSEPKPEPPPSVAAAAAGAVPAMDLDGAAERWAASHPGGGGSGGGPPPPSTETAGDRAARVLPAVLALVEGGLGALAAGQEGGEDGGPAVGAVPPPLDAAAAAKAHPPPPAPAPFPDDVAVRAFSSLRDAVEQALDYLELRVSAGPAALDADPLVPAAARAVGRLLADAPAAFGGRARRLLPDLLGAPRAGPALAPFFLPVLALATSPMEEEGEEALELDDGDRAEWLAAARQPRSLAGLAGGAAAAARAAAAAALGDAEDAALHASCTVLAGVMAGRPATAVSDAVPLADGLAPADAAGLAAALSEWVGARLGGGGGGGAAAATTAAHSALAGAPAAPACPPSDATTAAVAHALALVLHADAVARGPDDGGDDAMADAGAPLPPPRPDAEADPALVSALQRGWASSAVRAARAGEASRSKDELDSLPGLAAAAGEALLAWSKALVAAAAAVEARPRLARAAAAAPWVRELASDAGVLSHSAGGAALRLFLGTLRRAGAVPEDD